MQTYKELIKHIIVAKNFLRMVLVKSSKSIMPGINIQKRNNFFQLIICKRLL